MNFVLRVLVAILFGVLVTSLLEYFNVFTHGIDVLVGFIVALCFYFGYGADRRL